MKDDDAYTFTVLRYIHDTTTGEFLNVGVALHAPGHRYANAVCRNTYGRLSKVFPGINGEHFRSLMRYIQARLEELGEQLASELPLKRIESIQDLTRQVLPPDDSTLQWSPMGVGFTKDPAATLEQLYERLVTRYEERALRENRSDDDVWRHFKRTLETNQLLHHLSPRRIAVADDDIEFSYTWQNGILHCLEPISFDLSMPESIRDKAHKWLGRMTSVEASADLFRVYFLVGAPHEEDLHDAYANAISILRKSKVDTRIFDEHQVDELSRLLTEEVAQHEAAMESDE